MTLDLKAHVVSVHELKTKKCPICDKGFSKRYNLNRHIRALHPPGTADEKS